MEQYQDENNYTFLIGRRIRVEVVKGSHDHTFIGKLRGSEGSLFYVQVGDKTYAMPFSSICLFELLKEEK